MESNSDSKSELIEALSQASRGRNRFKKARLEEVIDDVEDAKSRGLSHKEIVAVLAMRGLVMSEGVFATTRNRILKKRGDVKHKSGQKTNVPSLARPARPAGPEPQKTVTAVTPRRKLTITSTPTN